MLIRKHVNNKITFFINSTFLNKNGNAKIIKFFQIMLRKNKKI